jgi:hypothetical protein
MVGVRELLVVASCTARQWFGAIMCSSELAKPVAHSSAPAERVAPRRTHSDKECKRTVSHGGAATASHSDKVFL